MREPLCHRTLRSRRGRRVTAPVTPACEARRHERIDSRSARVAGERARRRAALTAGEPDVAAAIVFRRQREGKACGPVTGQRVSRGRLAGEPARRVECA